MTSMELFSDDFLNVCHHVSLSIIVNMLLIYEEHSSFRVRKKGLKTVQQLSLFNIRWFFIPRMEIDLMSQQRSAFVHMSVHLFFQERQSCHGELTTRSNCSLGEFRDKLAKSFDVRFHVSICDSLIAIR